MYQDLILSGIAVIFLILLLEVIKIRKEFIKNEKSFLNVAGEGDDILYDEAIEYVVSMGMCSISSIQRKFRIGYNRAARLVDLLEEEGVIGPENGSKPREVLISVDEE
jgi:S-DNA-T family DNA segregation ATPase FtsK/SpoIIIE